MASLAQINDTQVSIINFKSIPVVTTEMLADFYGADVKNIQNNFLRNTGRFIEGKHFFKIVGQELREFKKSLTLLKMVSPNARALTLWTERGAARHAKMLDTDQAWGVFEQLEDCYFHRQEILAKTHKSDREPLTSAVNLLVAKTKHLSYSDAYILVHQRFNVEHIEDIPFETIPVAVEYVHHLIAMFNQQDKEQSNQEETGLANHAYNVSIHMLWVSGWWRCYRDAIQLLNPRMFSEITDHFSDGAMAASVILGGEKSKTTHAIISRDFPFDLSLRDRYAVLRQK